MTSSVTVRAPAKVNLRLSVGPVGADGYHPLHTVFLAVSLFDDVRVRPAPPGSGVSVAVSGTDSEWVPTGPENLAARAALALAEHLDRPADVRIEIAKRIPVAGGMAGGSADAAATLLACATLWRAGHDALPALAAGLGADVPFSLLGGCAIGTGRGDLLQPVPASGSFHWLFATSSEGLSTPAVYRRFDELGAAVEPTGDPGLLRALRAGDAEELGRSLRNDLQPAALSLRPDLGDLLRVGAAAGALGAVVSGSGPTCAFLVADEAAGVEAALLASGRCRSVHRAAGPVPGARVLG